jgi:hypothetical protein
MPAESRPGTHVVSRSLARTKKNCNPPSSRYGQTQDLRHSKINVTMESYTEAPSGATVEPLRKLSEQLAA